MTNKRYSSSIINLRLYHNWIKNKLYTDVAKSLKKNYNVDEINILELAVGKGGDLFKWIGISASNVIGVDIDKESIFGKNGAIHRYKRKLKQSNGDCIPKCYFYIDNLSDPESYNRMKKRLKNKKFNIISCQFAIHYFFESNIALTNISNIIGEFLEPNGYFIGTTMDPNKIYKLFTTDYKIEKDIFSIEFKTDIKNSYSPYNNKYIISLGKKDEDHYFSKKKSEEFIIDKKELEIILKKKNINKIEYKNFEEYYKCYYEEYCKKSKYIKKEIDCLTPNEKEYSFLNLSFIFQKMDV